MVLLEVIAALTIFALVGFSLVMALDASMTAAKRRNEIDTAMRGLSNQLALLHAAQLTVGEKDVPDDGSGISYHVKIEVDQMKDQKSQIVPNIYRATVTATWKSDGESEDRSLSELLYQP